MELVANDGVRTGPSISAVSLDPALDLRRRLPPLMTRFIRLAVVFEPLEVSESELEDDESSDELSIHAATGPGASSSSIMC
jgi:hypothetical protein